MKQRDLIKLCKALQNVQAVDFVKSIIKDSYRDFFYEHVREIEDMIERAFDLLVSSQKLGLSRKRLLQASVAINNNIFKKNNPSFWFNQIHKNYKIKIRSVMDYESVKKYIKGKVVLDLGSGGGYFALELEKHKFNVFTTDILDYRIKEASHLTFKRMRSDRDIPYLKDSIDTVIVKTVLHHVDKKYLGMLLRNLKRITRRLIIKEDTYSLPVNVDGLNEAIKYQPRLIQYISMKKVNQLHSLMIMDYFGNTLAQGNLEINLPFQFKTITEWKSLLKETGFTIRKVFLSGFEKHKLHRTCQVWIVCDRED